MKVAIAKRQGNVHVTLKGAFGDLVAAELASALPHLKKTHVVFDLAKVTAVNSIGFRAWTAFLRQLDESSSFEFLGCTPVFLEFCNLVPETSFAGRVTSAVVPYACTDCRRAAETLVQVADFDGEREFDLMVCGDCNGTLQATVAAAVLLEFRKA